jgi:uncharacterized protein
MGVAVAWISFTPVKGLRLHHLDAVELGADGIPGDRAFFLVDERGTMVSAPRLGPLVAVVAHYDAPAETLSLRFPDGREVRGPVELGSAVEVRFYQELLRARPVLGAFGAALSEHCGKPLRLMAAPPERRAVDRGPDGAVTLLSLASLKRLRDQAGAADPIDPRRFRMTFGLDGLTAHEEDGWIGRAIRLGDAVLQVTGNVGRCVLTTRDADTGVVDFDTLHHLSSYRRAVATTEPLPFGVHARVLRAGRVCVGDGAAPL